MIETLIAFALLGNSNFQTRQRAELALEKADPDTVACLLMPLTACRDPQVALVANRALDGRRVAMLENLEKLFGYPSIGCLPKDFKLYNWDRSFVVEYFSDGFFFRFAREPTKLLIQHLAYVEHWPSDRLYNLLEEMKQNEFDGKYFWDEE